jgi:hypothetical protein
MTGIRNLKRDDYTVVRYEELLALRAANHRLTLLEMAMRRILTQGQRDDVERGMKELDDDLPF